MLQRQYKGKTQPKNDSKIDKKKYIFIVFILKILKLPAPFKRYADCFTYIVLKSFFFAAMFDHIVKRREGLETH